MPNEMDKSQDEFDSAWDEKAPEVDSDLDDNDTSDDAADHENDDTSEELAESEDGAEEKTEEDEPDEKETHRLKSWEGRLKAEESRIKRQREELERRQMETDTNEGKDDVKDGEDTDNSPDDFESEYPEFADYARRKIEPLQQKLSVYEQEKQQSLVEAHTARIRASHPDAIELAQSPEFEAWIENQSYRKAQEYIQIKQQGSAEQVISMLDDFKKTKSNSRNHTQQHDAIKTRRTAKPKGRAAKDDFDGAWEEAISN